MTIEERIQQIVGAQIVQICALQTENEKLQERIKELEGAQAKKDASHLKEVK